MSGSVQTRLAHAGNNRFLKFVAAISTLAGWVSAAMILAAVLITCEMIFVRFVLNHSTIWQTETVIYLVIASTLIGLPYVQRLRGHVNVDLFPMSLKGRARLWLAFLTLGVTIAVIAVMFWHGYEYWRFAWDRNWKSDTVWGVRLWIPYFALPVGFGLLLLQLVADVVALILKVEKPYGLEDG